MAKAPEAKDPKQGDLIDKIELTAASEQAEIPAPPEEVVDEPEAEDASAALQKQVEALRKSEGILKERADRYRQEAERHQQLASERGSEIEKVRKEKSQSDLDSINAALGAAQEAADSAKRDLRTAENNGDVDAKIEAYDRLSIARSNISKLEDGKYEVEERIKNPPKAEQPVQQQAPKIPVRVQNWIDSNQKNLDNETWDKIRAFHWDVLREGHPFDSDEYIESMERRLGWREVEAAQPEPPRSQQRTSIVSAPVSREAPSSPGGDRGGQVKLTPAQREYAKIAGVTEKVYAEQLQKINKMKANGSYEIKGGG